MDSDTVNGRVFESLNAGFSDTAKVRYSRVAFWYYSVVRLSSLFLKVIREITLKSMLSLVGKLNEKNMNDSLMRSLAKLQVVAKYYFWRKLLLF